MKLSLITVCLNSESTIGNTIESVLDQTYKDIEYIICDGGSSDNTLNIIKSFDSDIKLIQTADNGIYDAINNGLKHATGEVVGIINSDDFYSNSDVLNQVMREFDNPGIDSVYGDLHYVQHDNINQVYRNWKSGAFARYKFKFGWTIPHPTFFVRNCIYDKYGDYDSNFRLAGDYEMEIRLLYRHKISTKYIPKVLVKMRNNGAGNGSVQKRMIGHKEDYLAWEKNGIKPPFYSIPLKPVRKIWQYISPKFVKRSDRNKTVTNTVQELQLNNISTDRSS